MHCYWRYRPVAHAYAYTVESCGPLDERPRAPRVRRGVQMFTWAHGPAFGVRRPLRLLSYRLDLSEAQTRQAAVVLDGLRTAQSQAQVDWDRSSSDLAAIFDGECRREAVEAALGRRARALEALARETADGIVRLHELLDPDQRRELAYLLRSGRIRL